MNKLRVKALEVLGGHCVWCGVEDVRVLQIDHVNGGGTAEVKRWGHAWMYRDVVRNPGKYQLLCANCNWIKRAERHEYLAVKEENVVDNKETILDPNLFGIKT